MTENLRMIDTPRIAGEPDGSRPISLDDRLRQVEADLIAWALAVTRGNKSKAAKLLQIKRSTLGDRINRCGLGQASRALDPPVATLHSGPAA